MDQWKKLPMNTKKKIMYGGLAFIAIIALILYVPFPGRGSSRSLSAAKTKSAAAFSVEDEDDDEWPEVPWWERNPEEAGRIRKMRTIINHIHATSGTIDELVDQEGSKSKLENKTQNLDNIKNIGREIFEIADNARSLVTMIVPPNPPKKPDSLKYKYETPEERAERLARMKFKELLRKKRKGIYAIIQFLHNRATTFRKVTRDAAKRLDDPDDDEGMKRRAIETEIHSLIEQLFSKSGQIVELTDQHKQLDELERTIESEMMKELNDDMAE